MARSKTTVRRGQPNPLFKETFMFQVPQIQLSDVTLMVAVNAVRSLKRKSDMVGWFSLGGWRSGPWFLVQSVSETRRPHHGSLDILALYKSDYYYYYYYEY